MKNHVHPTEIAQQLLSKRFMAWAGRHNGPGAPLQSFTDVNRYRTTIEAQQPTRA